MRKDETEVKFCKNKKCQKVLPPGYKHKYCEACRNKQAEGWKTAGKAVLGAAGTAACVAVAVITKGKIDPKK